MSDALADWVETSVGELFALDSGTAPIAFRLGDLSGPVQVYGANGVIGSSQANNFGPGYLIGRVGAVGSITRVEGRVWASDNTLTATPHPSRCDYRFAEHLLRFLNPARLSTMTAQPLITQGNLAKLSAWVPTDTTEQSRIAAVLDTVDEAIAETEAVIAKLKQVRAGLLHDFLTRGFDEDGQLRDPVAHPEQFQDSSHGRMPKAWRFIQLKNLVPPGRRITYGIVQPGEFDSNGILLIRGQDYIGGWAPRDSFFKVAPSRHESYRRSLTKAGDLLICIVGATTGAVAQVPEWIDESNITQTTARVACNTDMLLPRFAYHVLASEIGQRQVRRYIKGSAQPGLNLRDVEVFWVPVPHVEEQHTIAATLDCHADNLAATERELAKLHELKSGLMTDLLTGRVRVPEEIACA